MKIYKLTEQELTDLGSNLVDHFKHEKDVPDYKVKEQIDLWCRFNKPLFEDG